MRNSPRKGNDVLGSLQGFNGVDVNQRAMYGAVAFRIADDDSALENHDVFGMPNLMCFAVEKPKRKRLKGPTVYPFQNRFHVHTDKFTTRECP